ncbi:MAG: histidine kinase [Coriobacteriia bacterium]|nr:histidine kinase [Coriobacteriia bacterium]
MNPNTDMHTEADRILRESQLPRTEGPLKPTRHIVGKSRSGMDLRRRLKGALRMDTFDFLTIAGILALSATAVVAFALGWPQWMLALCAFLLAPIALALAWSHVKRRPDQLRARESDRITRTANEALPFMGEGLTPESAQSVCEIVLASSPSAVAVAITDEEHVLAFAGRGADHHTPGRPIVTEATHTALSRNETVVLTSKVAIGCKDPRCPLRAAIVVPLEVGSRVVGTLKYYYIRERALTETELASAEGLARLLSTQLIIHELENQATLATELELKALQAQINPHFLFNTINTISAYIRTDAEKARHLLRQFAGFYRRTLEHGDRPITLGLELEFLKQYFELEKARFGDQVNLSLDIDAVALDLPMPSFMLQPLVENSIEHGMRDDGSPLRVEVLVEYVQNSDTWMVTVSDDGVGINRDSLATIFEKSSSAGLGVALRNVSDRLRGFYGQGSELSIESTKGSGTEISFLIRDPD